ncbi:MAG: hypothetical protein V7L29_31055 [Nostoc sp.]|uniref:hypothetical protein n=1 Tax=Nostoc sp. TaxID=1180 RepID=UPI002FF2DE3A
MHQDALALQGDALTMHQDALTLQGIAKFNSLRINEMLYLAPLEFSRTQQGKFPHVS